MNNIFSNKGIESHGMRHLSAREAFEAIGEGAFLLDVREDFLTHMRTFAVENYIVCPLSMLDENISLLPKDKALIVSDATGLQSKVAVEKLLANGFNLVANLAGGIMDWDRDGFPVNRNPVAELSGQFPCMLKPMNVLKNRIIMKKRILILCTGNTCRSQMAEGILKHLDIHLEVFSAGTKAEQKVNPYAVKVMAEIGIDISQQQPKSVDLFLNETFDYVITVCDGANEICPVFTGKVTHRLHQGFVDPANATGTDEEKLIIYRKVRDEIYTHFKNFLSQINNEK